MWKKTDVEEGDGEERRGMTGMSRIGENEMGDVEGGCRRRGG